MLDRSECQKPSTAGSGGNPGSNGGNPGSGGGGTAVGKFNFRLGMIRSSKFRHVYGAPAKKQLCYDNVRITRNAHDSSFCAVNPKFLAVVVEVGGGGSFVVVPLERTGRLEHSAPKVR